MKLEKFTVSRYRSIDRAQNIVLGKDTTVLVGKNNEGKSNLLRALNLAIGQMKEIAKANSKPVDGVWNPNGTIRHNRNTVYDFEVDFPKKKSEKSVRT
ncbi:AAA family ATPase [Leuconostoc mesenteroides]|nr:AAA family ATPase [Leuconostoc mesenteroides]